MALPLATVWLKWLSIMQCHQRLWLTHVLTKLNICLNALPIYHIHHRIGPILSIIAVQMEAPKRSIWGPQAPAQLPLLPLLQQLRWPVSRLPLLPSISAFCLCSCLGLRSMVKVQKGAACVAGEHLGCLCYKGGSTQE